ncbi:MAG: TIGR02217 family protein [Cypionkella sp.]
MAFHDIRFPTTLSYGSAGGPMRLTEIVALANGFEERSTPWAHARRQYDAGFGLRSLADLETLLAFFEARRGQLHAFRWKDWTDYKSCPLEAEISALDQRLGMGNGVQTQFALTKRYASGDQVYLRPITKPVENTVYAAVGGDPKLLGQEFGVDYSTGVITFTDPPDIGAEVTAGFEFDVPARFDTDSLQISIAAYRAGDVPNVPIIEVRI